jgi:hypothetical protein
MKLYILTLEYDNPENGISTMIMGVTDDTQFVEAWLRKPVPTKYCPTPHSREVTLNEIQPPNWEAHSEEENQEIVNALKKSEKNLDVMRDKTLSPAEIAFRLLDIPEASPF